MFTDFLLSVIPVIVIAIIIGVGVWYSHRPKGSKVLPIEPWPNPPALSCFVKGLIRSMKETPGEWKRSDFTIFTCSWKHRSSEIRLAYQSSYSIDPDTRGLLFINDDPHRNNFEHDAIVKALYNSLETPFQVELRERMVEAKAKKDAEFAIQRAPFEKLGCPDSQ